MLDIRTLTTAADLAAVLNTQGIVVQPAGGSPLAKLNQTLVGPGLGNLTGITTPDEEQKKEYDPGFIASMVSFSETTLPDGSPTEYQAYMTLLAKEVAASVSGTISFARNTVNPIINDICEKISIALDEAGKGGTIARTAGGQRFVMSNSSLVVNILTEAPEPLYMDEVTVRETNARLNLPYQNLRSPVFYPEMTSAELLEFMEENSKGEFNRDVLDTLKAREDGIQELYQVYTDVYRFIPGYVTGTDINSLRNDVTIRPLIILAIANALAEELPEGTTGSSSDIEKATLAWMGQVKNIIEINLEVYRAAVASKQIVLSAYTTNFETNIQVNQENYNSYLEDGGSTEALLGAVFSDKDYEYDNLITRQQEYEEVYHRRVSEAASYNESNRLTIFKNVLRECVRKEIFECEEDAIRPVEQANARENLDALMKKVYVDALDCPYEVVRMVVCGSLFDGTDVEEILVNIDNVCKKNEDLSPRDAAALVVLDYLASYLVCQMDITRGV